MGRSTWQATPVSPTDELPLLAVRSIAAATCSATAAPRLAAIETRVRRCEWFALCENEATHDEPHPVLGSVPCCDRCATFASPEASS